MYVTMTVTISTPRTMVMILVVVMIIIINDVPPSFILPPTQCLVFLYFLSHLFSYSHTLFTTDLLYG
jgi:hypothetical protein